MQPPAAASLLPARVAQGLQPLSAECSSRGETPSALQERGGVLLGGKRQQERDMEEENSALKWSFPILTLKPWETAGLPSHLLKQDDHRDLELKPAFTETFPRQQLLSSVKPAELKIKLWAAHVLTSQVPQSSDRLTGREGTITPLCQTSYSTGPARGGAAVW